MKLLLCHTDVVMRASGLVTCTKGKWYPVIQNFDSTISIINDDGRHHMFRRYSEDGENVRTWFTEAQGENLDFGNAIILLKAGLKMARKGWNGKNMWIQLQRPDSLSKMSLPYIYMKTADDHQVPWLASQTDMLAEDWEVVV